MEDFKVQAALHGADISGTDAPSDSPLASPVKPPSGATLKTNDDFFEDTGATFGSR